MLAATFSLNLQAQKSSMPIGTQLPAEGYNLTDVLTNKETKLDDLKTDKGLLVIFTCNTCPFVIKNIDRTRETLEAAQAYGIGVALVNSNEAQRSTVDSPEEMTIFGKKQGYPNYFADKNAALADIFGASHTPEVFLFDGKTGKLVYKGAMDDNPGDPGSAKTLYLKNAFVNLTMGRPIEPKETKSVGCSIKRVKS